MNNYDEKWLKYCQQDGVWVPPQKKNTELSVKVRTSGGGSVSNYETKEDISISEQKHHKGLLTWFKDNIDRLIDISEDEDRTERLAMLFAGFSLPIISLALLLCVIGIYPWALVSAGIGGCGFGAKKLLEKRRNDKILKIEQKKLEEK